MKFTFSPFVITALFFLFTFMSGRWAKQRGMPYPVMLVTLHKLIALGMGIYIGWQVFLAGSLSSTEMVLIVVTFLLAVVNVATGSIYSRNKPVANWISVANKVVPYLTLLFALMLINLLGA